MLETAFIELAGRYTDNAALILRLWEELKTAYVGKGRYYHNLDHITSMVTLAEEHRSSIQDWDAMLFAIYYHDAVYKATRKDNEEKSAELATRRLTDIGAPEILRSTVYDHIIATKTHGETTDADRALLLDIDLNILSAPWSHYLIYTQQIRKEYKIFPDLLYNPGRKKVLKHLLDLPEIYKTPAFRERYEETARANLAKEIAGL